MGDINKLINWFKAREGKVTYSMINRLGPYSYDCSSAVFNALIEAGFLPKGTWPGNTETLYALEGKLLVPISRNQVQNGDIFVAGVKGDSLGAGGHTGVALSNSQIIHCNYAGNGITTTGISNNTTYYPCHWYRLKGATSGNTNNSTNQNTTKEKGMSNMFAMFQIKGSNTIYYWNGCNETVTSINNPDQKKLYEDMYRKNFGKEIPFITWQTNGPWYNHLLDMQKRKGNITKL